MASRSILLLTVLLLSVLFVLLSGCGGGGGNGQPSFNYVPIPGVPPAVNNLGKLIGQQERNVVTPGGNQWDPGYSSADQAAFDSSNRLAQIVGNVSGTQTFAAGVVAIRALPASTQQQVFTSFSTPIDPTWAMTGTIGNGTTDAGEAVESEIATALMNAVKSAL